jgi:hypothetical protein
MFFSFILMTWRKESFNCIATSASAIFHNSNYITITEAVWTY